MFRPDGEKYIPAALAGYPYYNVSDPPSFKTLSVRLRYGLSADYDYRVPHHNAVGRENEIRKILDILSEGKNVWIHGMGGLGKTFLACAAANEFESPDERVFIDLRNTSLCSTLAMNLAINFFEPQANRDEQKIVETFRSNIYGKKVLFVIDNVVDDKQAGVMLKHIGPTSNSIIIRTRLPYAYNFKCPPLSEGALVDVLKSVMNEREPSKQDISDIIELCGRLPLAIDIAGTYLRNNPAFEIKEYIRELKSGHRLERLNESDPARKVELVLRISLEKVSSEQAERWRLLSVFPTFFDRHGAECIWDVSSENAFKQLTR